MSLNDTETLIDRIGYPDDDTSEGELQETLDRANRRMQNRVGKHYIEDKTVRVTAESDGEIVNEFDLDFGPILEVDEILLNQYEVVDESNYTVDKEAGTITFDQNFVDEQLFRKQVIRFKYKPVQFKDIELYRAVALIKNQEIVQLEDTEQTSLYQNAEALARETENEVNRRAGTGTASDGHVRRGTK